MLIRRGLPVLAVLTLLACGPGKGALEDAGFTSIGVSPESDDLLTCESLQFSQLGGAAGGTWSVSPSGTGSVSSSGLYTAPTTAPANADVSVSYAVDGKSGSAQLTLATAFPGTPVSLPINGDSNLVNAPFEHQFTANGSTIYAGILGSDSLSAVVLASGNGGGTFHQAGSYHTGAAGCVTTAVDSGDPQTVYLVYQGGHGDSTSNTGQTVRLAVSTDGGQTFPVEYVLADSLNQIATTICPDVISPAPGQVIVFAVSSLAGNETDSFWVSTFVSGNKGADIGPTGTEGQCVECPSSGAVWLSPSDTNAGSAETLTDILSDSGNAGPRAGTNGKGMVCMTFQYDGGNSPSTVEVQCSANSGMTWTAPLSLGAYGAINSGNVYPTVAVSPGGKVAVAWIGVDPTNSFNLVYIALSTNGGMSFGTPITYTATDMDYPSNPVVAWENDDVLWLSQTLAGNASLISIDKTCDDGQTWSGAVMIQNPSLQGTSLVKTSSGMVVGGENVQGPTLDVISLGGFGF